MANAPSSESSTRIGGCTFSGMLPVIALAAALAACGGGGGAKTGEEEPTPEPGVALGDVVLSSVGLSRTSLYAGEVTNLSFDLRLDEDVDQKENQQVRFVIQPQAEAPAGGAAEAGSGCSEEGAELAALTVDRLGHEGLEMAPVKRTNDWFERATYTYETPDNRRIGVEQTFRVPADLAVGKYELCAEADGQSLVLIRDLDVATATKPDFVVVQSQPGSNVLVPPAKSLDRRGEKGEAHQLEPPHFSTTVVVANTGATADEEVELKFDFNVDGTLYPLLVDTKGKYGAHKLSDRYRVDVTGHDVRGVIAALYVPAATLGALNQASTVALHITVDPNGNVQHMRPEKYKRKVHELVLFGGEAPVRGPSEGLAVGRQALAAAAGTAAASVSCSAGGNSYTIPGAGCCSDDEST